MKSQSQEETPPSTMGSVLLTWRIAEAASLTMSANRTQPGSSLKFQCERLLGSFHNTIASTIGEVPRLLLPDRSRLKKHPGRVWIWACKEWLSTPSAILQGA